MIRAKQLDVEAHKYYVNTREDLLERKRNGEKISEKQLENLDKRIEELENRIEDMDFYYSKDNQGVFNDPNNLLSELNIKNGQKVSSESFKRLMSNQHPSTGEQLNKNIKDKDNYRSGVDVEYSPCRDFSVLCALANDKYRKILEEMLMQSVQEGMDLMREKGAYRNVGASKNKEIVKTDIAAAMFQHMTTRNLDPHNHVHMIVFMLTKDEQGNWKSIDQNQIFNWCTAVDASINASLMKNLKQRFPTLELERNDGIGPEDRGHAFRIKNIPRDLVLEFSSRRNEMMESLDKEILAGTVMKDDKEGIRKMMDRLWSDLRKGKSTEDIVQLRKDWSATALKFGITNDFVNQLLDVQAIPLPPLSDDDFKAAVKQSMDDLLQTEAACGEDNLYRNVAENLYGKASASEIRAKMDDLFSGKIVMDGEDQVITLIDRNGEIRKGNKKTKRVCKDGVLMITTKEMERKERELIYLATKMALNKSHTMDKFKTDAVLDKYTVKRTYDAKGNITYGISEEQLQAVKWILKPNQFSIVSGVAGSGKTYMLDVAREALEADGYQVIGVSGAWKQSKELELGAKIKSISIATFIKMYKEGKLKLDSKTAVIMDEAGMSGTKQAYDIQAVCDKHGCKLVWTGEEQQMLPATAGGAMTLVGQRVESFMLEDIRRQKDPLEHKLVKAIRAGLGANALDNLRSRGRLTIAKDKSAMFNELIQDWADYTLKNPSHTTGIIAMKNADKRELGIMARDILRQRGILSGKDYTIKAAIPVTGHNKKTMVEMDFSVGEPVVFRKIDKKLGITNQDAGTIVGILEQFDGSLNISVSVKVEGKPDKVVTINTKKYIDEDCGGVPLESGLSITTYNSQGMSRDAIFSVLDDADRRNGYIDLSRHKSFVKAYADASRLKAAIYRQKEARHIDITDDMLFAQLAGQLSVNSYKVSTQDIPIEKFGSKIVTLKDLQDIVIAAKDEIVNKVDDIKASISSLVKSVKAATMAVTGSLERQSEKLKSNIFWSETEKIADERMKQDLATKKPIGGGAI